MRTAALLTLVFWSFKSFSQDDQFRVLFGANAGWMTIENNEIVPPGFGYENLSWNEDQVVHSTNFSTTTSKYNCHTFMGEIGVSVPFARINRISFGVEPKFGFGILRSNEYVDKNDLTASKNVKGWMMHASGLLYVRCRLGEEFHISLMGGYRLAWTRYNWYSYQTPVVGLEFGINQCRIGVYGYFTKLQFNRQLSNGTTYPIRIFSDLGSVSLYYTLGTGWFETQKWKRL